MRSHKDWSRAPLNIMLAGLIALSASVLLVGGMFTAVEDSLVTRRAELLTRAPSGQTVIVEIDANSLAQLRSWPWPRRYHAQLVRELHAAGASVIGFDVDFSARSESGDQEFASAIAEAGNVVIPIFQQQSSDRASDQRILSSRPDAAFSAAWVGGVNIFPGRDGIVRDYPAATLIDGAIQPSLATLIAEKNGQGDRLFQPDWSIDARQIPRFSFVDVINGRVPHQLLRNKRVLIGATAIELGDRYAVPRYGVVSGVVVQALATESLLQDRAIQLTGLPVTIFGIMLIALLLAPRRITNRGRLFLLYASITLVVVVGPILAQMVWPVAVSSAAWLFTLLASATAQVVVESRRKLRWRTQFDNDSGLPNRLTLEKSLVAVPDAAGVLVVGAIERFEAIRDGIGTSSTNEMIRASADLIGSLVRQPIHRIAPDTLAWMQPDDDPVETVLERIADALRKPIETRAGPIDVTFTFGLDRDDGNSAPVLRVERALSAIANARSSGTATAWYNGVNPVLRRQLSMMSDLRLAMEANDLKLAYQPKMCLHSGRITGVEALARWHDSAGNMVSPDDFIPLAEATGVIREVTIFVLRRAVADLQSWDREGIELCVAINVSAVDLITPGFADQVNEIVVLTGIAPSRLTLEVTESALIRSPHEAIAALKKLRHSGIRLSVDDYGTGQSTLSYVKHLPVHELKIDKSFITALANDESDVILVRSTIDLAHKLGIEVVAEGIEDQLTLEALRQMGCDFAQGYFISKPMVPEALVQFVTRNSDLSSVA